MIGAVLASLAACGQVGAGDAELRLAMPIKTWDEGVPLGNGELGALLWGEGNRLNVSLDAANLWDLRTPEMLSRPDWTYSKMIELHAKQDWRTMHEYFDVPYDTIAYPTKLPAGRLEIELHEPMQQLSLKFEEGIAREVTTPLTAWVGADGPVFFLDTSIRSINLRRPESLAKLGYQDAERGETDGVVWFRQKAALGLQYAVAYLMRGGDYRLVATVTWRKGGDPVPDAVRRLKSAIAKDWTREIAAQKSWWQQHARTSSVKIPDPRIQAQYDFAKYLYGAGSRPGAPPIPLQGVWTADAGTLPPWKGDYHNDLNTQTTYIAYHTAGLNESGEAWLDFNWKLLPQYRAFAKSFYGVDGAVVPGVMTLDGKPMGGWGQYSLSPTNGAWVAQSFFRHWRTTQDRKFLRERAWPFCREIGMALRALLKPDPEGKLKLPLSSSPEIYDNSPKAWLPPNSNYDWSLCLFIFGANAEMATSLGLDDEAQKWGEAAIGLGDPVLDESGAFAFAAGHPIQESHRHHSHLMAIHPLTLFDPEFTSAKRTIDRSLAATLKHGTQAWVGYSFSWMACILARAGHGDEAEKYLSDYARAFVLRNGFHANGDQIGAGLSGFRYRPVTLEGNFLAMEAVHEMLLQSARDRVKVFPSVPNKWQDVSFRDLRAEGGLVISAERKAGRTEKVTIRATVDRESVRILLPDSKGMTWTPAPRSTRTRTLEWNLRKGQTIEGRRK